MILTNKRLRSSSQKPVLDDIDTDINDDNVNSLKRSNKECIKNLGADSPNSPTFIDEKNTLENTNSFDSFDDETSLEIKNIVIDDDSNTKKRVKFNKTVKVALIPSRQEFKSAQLNEELWWNDLDYILFKERANQQIKYVLQLTGTSDAKEVMKFLYQPNYEFETAQNS